MARVRQKHSLWQSVSRKAIANHLQGVTFYGYIQLKRLWHPTGFQLNTKGVHFGAVKGNVSGDTGDTIFFGTAWFGEPLCKSYSWEHAWSWKTTRSAGKFRGLPGSNVERLAGWPLQPSKGTGRPWLAVTSWSRWNRLMGLYVIYIYIYYTYLMYIIFIVCISNLDTMI